MAEHVEPRDEAVPGYSAADAQSSEDHLASFLSSRATTAPTMGAAHPGSEGAAEPAAERATTSRADLGSPMAATGDVRVDAAIARLPEARTDDHSAAFDTLQDVYERLHSVLTQQ